MFIELNCFSQVSDVTHGPLVYGFHIIYSENCEVIYLSDRNKLLIGTQRVNSGSSVGKLLRSGDPKKSIHPFRIVIFGNPQVYKYKKFHSFLSQFGRWIIYFIVYDITDLEMSAQ